MKASALRTGMKRFKQLELNFFRKFIDAPPKLDKGLMGLRKEHSVLLLMKKSL